MDSIPEKAIADNVRRSVLAVAEYAREIVLHERAQAARHFANIGLGHCDCEDCRKEYRYPVAFYPIARRYAARYGFA